MENKPTAHGVQELIDRLKGEGVDEGRKRAETLVEEARTQAVAIVQEAQNEALLVRRQADLAAAQTQSAMTAALELAVRDAMLKLKEEILERISDQLREVIRQPMADPEFFKEWLIEITRDALPTHPGPRRLLLSQDVVSDEQLRQNPDDLARDSLDAFVALLARDVLSRGIEIASTPDHQLGIRIDLVDQDVRIDLTQDAVSRLLLRHLTPRFRGMMEGIVRKEAES